MTEEQAVVEIDNQEAGVIDLAQFLDDLHKQWKPHAGQVAIGSALFYQGYTDIFACCGRNFGKTEVISYCVHRYAKERPKSENYIFGPVQKQIKEILWASGRIQGFVPEKYLQAINNTEMRIILNNGSFIKLDGSDNIDSYRGIKPKGLSVYDEFKDMQKGFIDAYDPNRAAFNSPAIHIGTPPEFHNHFVDTMNDAKAQHGKTWFFLQAPTSMNPHISKEWLSKKKASLERMGDVETWLREYEAIYVVGGKRHVFPQAVKFIPIPFNWSLFGELKEWKFHFVFDPASSSTFAVALIGYNEFSKRSIMFDEIYQQDQSLMTARQIWAQVFELRARLTSRGVSLDKILYVYDEAASWFRNETNEIRECKGLWLEPTNKAMNSKESGISIIRDAFNRGLFDITDNCVKTIWEFSNYMKDENGKIPKENDHLIDGIRYYFASIGYNLHELDRPPAPDPLLQPRFSRLEDDLPSSGSLVDFDSHFRSNGYQEID